jgi:hypothetical protein
VFPTTTASAITTYLTGDAPQQHGSPAGSCGSGSSARCWRCCRAAPLRRRRLCAGGRGPARPARPSAHLRTHGDAVRRRLAELHRPLGLQPGPPRPSPPAALQIAEATVPRQRPRHSEGTEPSYFYAYWPGLDGVGHEHGMESARAVDHFRESTGCSVTSCAASPARIPPSWSARTTATWTAPPRTSSNSPITRTSADCLRMPLCGEPRAAYCYLRPDRVEQFTAYCRNRLADRFDLHRSQDLIDAGLFGNGEHPPRLAERIGDQQQRGEQRQERREQQGLRASRRIDRGIIRPLRFGFGTLGAARARRGLAGVGGQSHRARCGAKTSQRCSAASRPRLGG